MRIVSLLPSATEIAVALGFADNIVGRSHECDFPESVRGLPALTASKLRKGLSSLEIDHHVKDIVGQGLSVYDVDAAQLRALRPDIILTQTQCAVCAVTPDDLQIALNEWLGKAPQLISLAPDTLTDVWGDIRRVAGALNVPSAGGRVVGALEARLQALRAGVVPETRPTVAAIEWTEPLMAAGNWVPELIETAGGLPLFAAAGQHSAVADVGGARRSRPRCHCADAVRLPNPRNAGRIEIPQRPPRVATLDGCARGSCVRHRRSAFLQSTGT